MVEQFYRFKTEDEALAVANGVSAGLAGKNNKSFAV